MRKNRNKKRQQREHSATDQLPIARWKLGATFKPLMTPAQLDVRREIDYSAHQNQLWMLLQFDRSRPMVAERVLQDDGQVVYLPFRKIFKRDRLTRDRVQDVVPAFGGYLFLMLNPHNPPWQVIKTKSCLHSVMRVGRAHEIEYVRITSLTQIRHEEIVGEYDYLRGSKNIAIEVGQKVVISDDVLEGMKASVLAVHNVIATIELEAGSSKITKNIHVDSLEIAS